MSPSRTARPPDPLSPSANAPPDPFLDFPRESDLNPALSPELSSPQERSAGLRQSPSKRGSKTLPVNTDVASERARPFTMIAIGIGLVVGVVFGGIRYVPEVAWPANLGAASAPVVIEAGKITAQQVDFADEPLTGGLEVTSDPEGARVSIDGMPRGQTPLTIPEFAPGQHRVTISSGGASVERTVAVTAGATATVVVVVWKPEPTFEETNQRQVARVVLPTTEVLAAPNRVIYTALDRDVTPPVELERNTPVWNPPAQFAGRRFRGVVQVVIDERGSVESAQLVWSLADFYDPELLEAARSWRFNPALRAGQPVTYRKIVEIAMGPER